MTTKKTQAQPARSRDALDELFPDDEVDIDAPLEDARMRAFEDGDLPPSGPIESDPGKPEKADGKPGGEKADAETGTSEDAGSQPQQPSAESGPDEKAGKIDVNQFKGYIDEREKRQRAERELEEYKRRLEALQAPQDSKEVPDPVTDPDGFRAYQDKAFAAQRMAMSEMMAKAQYSQEQLDAAVDAVKSETARNPYLADRLRASPHPYLEMMQWYENEHKVLQFVSQAGGLDKLIEQKVNERLAAAGARPPQPVAQPPGTPPSPALSVPPSLAARPSAAPQQPDPVQTEQEFFEDIFKR